MRIAVIGAGAMGSIYGGHLSLHNDVYLVDTNPNVVAAVNENGLKLQEYGTDNLYHPKAVTSTEGIEPVDLIILFVKALFSKAALAGNKALIGPNTYVLTLQNGSGHEDILGEFVDLDHIIIGTTEDNGAVLGMGYIRHGGEGFVFALDGLFGHFGGHLLRDGLSYLIDSLLRLVHLEPGVLHGACHRGPHRLDAA